MGKFICKKPVTLSGRSFTYGEEIPDGCVLPTRALALVRSGYIVEVDTDGGPKAGDAGTPGQPSQAVESPALINIPLMTEKGVMEAEMEPRSVVTALTIMQKNVEDAGKDIAMLEDADALIILNAADSRKSVRKAAEERAAQLRLDMGVDGPQDADVENLRDAGCRDGTGSHGGKDDGGV